jgi:holo-[acyl-carrier protein] synthase
MRIGTDIVEVKRIRAAIERTGQAFIDRVYTEAEAAYCDRGTRRRFESYAARFAAKEAYSKAAGTGIGENAALHEIEVVNGDNGRPELRLYGTALDYFEEHFPGQHIDVSLSHTASIAIATVVIG